MYTSSMRAALRLSGRSFLAHRLPAYSLPRHRLPARFQPDLLAHSKSRAAMPSFSSTVRSEIPCELTRRISILEEKVKRMGQYRMRSERYIFTALSNDNDKTIGEFVCAESSGGRDSPVFVRHVHVCEHLDDKSKSIYFACNDDEDLQKLLKIMEIEFSPGPANSFRTNNAKQNKQVWNFLRSNYNFDPEQEETINLFLH